MSDAGWSWPARLATMIFSGVFMLAFGAGGIWGGVLPLWQTFSTALAARSFQPVRAQVTAVDLVSRRGSKSTTWEVQARYAYRWQERDFEGTRIGVAGTGADNIGSWQADWHQRLKQARESEQNIVAWVDPGQPGRALLDRSVRWGLVALHLPFAVLFTGVGLGASVIFFGALLNRLPDKTVTKGRTVKSPPRAGGGQPATVGPPANMARVMRGRLGDGSEVLFLRRWPRVVGVLMLVALTLWLMSGPVERGPAVLLAALPATAWTCVALHLITLRWSWRLEAGRLRVRRASWLHDRQHELSRTDLKSLQDKLVYTSSTNGGPTVHHKALVARGPTGDTVALTPALPGPAALQAVRGHLREALRLEPTR